MALCSADRGRGAGVKVFRLPERFSLLIEGKLWNVRRRSGIVPNELPYAVGRLLNGDTAAVSTFEAHGLRVTVECDTDQGDDAPDGLAIR